MEDFCIHGTGGIDEQAPGTSQGGNRGSSVGKCILWGERKIPFTQMSAQIRGWFMKSEVLVPYQELF